ncbi:PspA/IM30 family protein [Sphingobacterium paludis]|uniref:Phage shock protein A (PspA) family protein n=1 Tax=Sphingobacterium paludis TaxID=1476465 RepID=A0A4R7CTN1_9SPHI|nr:PspA/IM30 family protein [Sphingobacterium paludis]TDS10374.1 phage shock protein A (PspA) family protein [Sphingobacterium paludis]
MNIFKRILKIGQAEIHALVDMMEDPISLTEQGIRDMKKQLHETTESAAKVRASIIRTENMIVEKEQETALLADKAKSALTKAQEGELTPEQGEKLATEALLIKKRMQADVQALRTEINEYEIKHEEIHKHIDILEVNISKWEKELTTLRAKQKVNEAASLANRQMANIDSNSTLDMLHRVKNKVANDEALAEAYAEIAQSKIELPDERKAVHDELAALKKQMGID